MGSGPNGWGFGMLRFVQALSIAAAIAAAVVLYVVSYSTRAMKGDVETAERRIEELTRELSVLRAERAYLGRPERLEIEARKLGMRPLEGRQIENVGTRETVRR